MGLVAQAASAAQPARLIPDHTHELRPEPGCRYVFSLAFSTAEPWLITASQDGPDVRLILARSHGNDAVHVDAPTHGTGTEFLLVEPQPASDYELTVACKDDPFSNGTVSLRLTRLNDTAALSAASAMTSAGGKRWDDNEADRTAALGLYRQASELWHQAGLGDAEISALTASASLLFATGDLAAARQPLERSLALTKRHPSPRLEAALLTFLGRVDADAGQGDAARKMYERAMAIQYQFGFAHERAATQNNLCLLQLRQGHTRDALACFEETAAALDSLGDESLRAIVLNNMGGVYYTIAEPQSAQRMFEKALAIHRSLGDREQEAYTLNNLAALHHRLLGNPAAALPYYREALELHTAIGDRRAQGRVRNNIGFVYLALGELDRARVFFTEALALRRAIEDRRGEATALSNLGAVALQEGKLDEAGKLNEEALAIRRELDAASDTTRSLIWLGLTRIAQNRPQAAIALLDEALRRADAAKDEIRIADALHARGRALAALERWRDADESLRAALEHRGAGRRPIESAETLYEIGRARFLAADFAGAADALRESIDTVEQARTAIPVRDLRATYFALGRAPYELYAHLLMTSTDDDHSAVLRALQVSERAHARTLLDTLRAGGIEPGELLSPEMARQYVTLSREAEAKSQRRALLVGSGSETARAAADKEWLEARFALDALLVKAANEAAPELLPPQPVAQLQASLPPDTALIEYLLTDYGSHGWVVAQNSVRAFPLPPRAEIEQLAVQVHRELAHRTVGAHGPSAALRRLSRLILPPSGMMPTTPRLAIVADGALHYVPFAALVLENAPTAPWLIQHYELSYLPSGGLLNVRGKRPERAPGAGIITVFADPIFASDDKRLPAHAVPKPLTVAASEGAQRSGLELVRLAGSGREARAIAALNGAKRTVLHTGPGATREAVLSLSGESSHVIHFATHGMIDTRFPHLSGLMLSRFDSSGTAVNGFLDLQDIYRLHLDADLVVLSACETVLGRHVRGEGLQGLARGFLQAGARGVVASLWRVADAATSRLVVAFYRDFLGRGHAPPAALRAAQLALLNDPRARGPEAWAAWVHVGGWAKP